MMQAKGSRTFICSVAFLDIVEYSKKGVTVQITLKEQLNRLLAEAMKGVAPSDRIILDTGDGAAISFVGDPEEALFVCLMLRDALVEQRSGQSNNLNVRIGINLGPVKLIKDLNNQANLVGDGINVAQRVMSFAEPNQILVSRSYFEVVSCLSESYAKMFRYEGSRTDKHVREHEVYAVSDGTGELRRSLEATHAATVGRQPTADMARDIVNRVSKTTKHVKESLRTRPRLSTVVAVVGILVLAVAIRGMRGKPPETAVAAPAPAAPVVTRATGPLPEKLTAAPAPKIEAAPAPREKVVAPPTRDKVVAKPARKDRVAAAPAVRERTVKEKAAVRAAEPDPAPEPPPPAPAPPGFIAFAITPWGEIIVDGKSLGVSPPLQEVKLAAGRHRIEVRNTNFTPLVRIVEVKSGERIRIKHRFQ